MEVHPLLKFRSDRTFVCTHCGTWFKSDKYNEKNESQCPFCGEWAVHIESDEAKAFERAYFTVSKVHDDEGRVLNHKTIMAYTKRLMEAVQ